MKKILLILFLLPSISFAQNKGDYAQVNGTLAISKPFGNGGGGTFAVQHMVNKNASFGGGFDLIKYKNLDKILPSIYADLRYHLGTGISRPLVYFSLTPGYTVYNSSTKILIGNRYDYFNYKSGFSFGGGFGCIFYSGNKTAPFISVMYDNFPLSLVSDESSTTTRYDVIKINFGLTF